jgi:hypothetical protein
MRLPRWIASHGLQYSLIKPSVDQVRLYFSAFEGNCGSAPTRMNTRSNLSKPRVSSCAATDTKPGASPHCGMKTCPGRACSEISAMRRVVATSSVRSK